VTRAPLTVLPARRPEVVQARLTEALRAGAVPGRFLYDAPAQAERWLAYHRAWAPAARAASVLARLYDDAFAAAWAAAGPGPLTYVGLGCGGGAKDARFMALGPASQPAAYVAADTSPDLVEAALAAVAAARPDAALRGVVFDLLAAPTRAELHPGGGAAVWSALGILPNVDAAVLLPLLAGLAEPGEGLLVSANLSPVPYPAAVDRVVPQYDNPEARAWYQGALDELGLGLADAPVAVTHRALTPDGAIWRVEATATLTRAAALGPAEAQVHLPAGARLAVFHSDRYLPEAMPGVFAQHGLTLKGAWVAEDREEGTYLAELTGRRGPGASST
jgi:uncharacterized SAM-dependent methyltransferase